jgi:cell shape-determining protein MreC
MQRATNIKALSQHTVNRRKFWVLKSIFLCSSIKQIEVSAVTETNQHLTSQFNSKKSSKRKKDTLTTLENKA